jgi:hypothetical protein
MAGHFTIPCSSPSHATVFQAKRIRQGHSSNDQLVTVLLEGFSDKVLRIRIRGDVFLPSNESSESGIT